MRLREKLCCSFFFFYSSLTGARCSRGRPLLHERVRGLFLFSIFSVSCCFCGAAVPCHAVLFRACIPRPCHTAYRKKKISALPAVCTYVRMYVRHVTLGIIKSPICNYNNHENTCSIIDVLSASRNSMYASFQSERSGRRRPPTEPSALYKYTNT